MYINIKNTAIIVILAMLTTQASMAGDSERNQAKRIHDRLTGVPASNATIDAMETLIINDSALPVEQRGKSAAEYAISTLSNPDTAPAFYNITLKNFAAPWTNEEQTVFVPLNDYTATFVGMVRDQVDFRQILHGDIIYRGFNAPGYSDSNNNHYEQLESLGPVAGDLSNSAILIADTQSNVTAVGLANGPGSTAGVMTTRAGAMSFFSDGTNRAMFRFTLMNHLCTDLEPLKDISRPPDRIRRDVSRSPGGDSRIFLNSCVGCHAGMDGMAGAFAFYEWNYNNDKSDGNLVFTDGLVQNKHLINEDNFKPGYLTDDDSWVNYWRNGPNKFLGNRPGDSTSGWAYSGEPPLDSNGNAVGNGAKSLGRELANSKAFAQCQVDKVFKAICLRDPNVFTNDRSARDGFVTNFTGSGYDLQEVFTDSAAYCKGS
jgi:hypothetical protein